MTSDSPSPLGPLFGPDFLMVTVNDETKTSFSLEVYPDANNALLKANGLQQQFYFVPQRVYVAKKQDSPQDFDFGMAVFKGLMTSEDTVGISPTAAGGDVEAGGGFCVFSTTFAIPDSVIANAIQALKTNNYSGSKGAGSPAPPRFAGLLDIGKNDPDPKLGIVPILSNDVTLQLLDASAAGSAQAPMILKAVSTEKGSIEAHGINSFLVTCNQFAAGAVAGAVKNGLPPFVVQYNLTEQYYLPACDITVTVDMDKVFDSFSVAASASGFFESASFSAAYQNTVTRGGIVTDIKINGAAIPPDLKTFIDQKCQDMQTFAMNAVKDQIFDWKPTDGGPATTSGSGGGLFGSLFGFGAQVSMKATYQKQSLHFTQELKLDTVVTMTDAKYGDLTDLQPALAAHPEKYLVVYDIGEYFKKIQVAATNAINWSETLPDGTKLSDPITSAMIEVSYPDYTQPLDSAQQPNLKTLGQGFHYLVGQSGAGQAGLAQWSANNPSDIINIAYLRLDQQLPQWPSDQVKVRKTLIFDGNDPRVDLLNNATTVVVETTGNDHTPIITGAEVGYLFTRFFCRPLPAAVTLTLTTTIGPRTDTITITQANQKNVLWEIFSDKYVAQTSFTYSVQVQVQGPNFTDNPITYQSAAPITVKLPGGRVKYLNAVSLQLPDAPPDQIAQINAYIKNYQLQPVS